MASENGLDTLANMILVGKLIRESGVVDFSHVDAVLDKIVSARRQELKAFNKQALELGYNYVG
jgi:2-oxoglutarate ferredoxin oxidoreductase subunit gamma